jgi:hypothetical protein
MRHGVGADEGAAMTPITGVCPTPPGRYGIVTLYLIDGLLYLCNDLYGRDKARW